MSCPYVFIGMEKPTRKYRAICMGRLYNEQMIPDITSHTNFPRLNNLFLKHPTISIL